MTEYVWADTGLIHLDGTEELELLIVSEEVMEFWVPRVDVVSCTTWGQVKALGSDVYQEVLRLAGYGEFADFIAGLAIAGQVPRVDPGPEQIVEWMSKHDSGFPADGQGFEALYDIPLVAEGEWPRGVHRLIAETVPAAILSEFADWTRSSTNGDFARIPFEHKDAVLDKLGKSGHSYRYDSRVRELEDVV